MATTILIVTQAPRPEDEDSSQGSLQRKNTESGDRGRSRSNTTQSVHSPVQPLHPKIELTASHRDDLLNSYNSQLNSSTSSSPRTQGSISPYGSKISPLAPSRTHPLINDIFSSPTLEETQENQDNQGENTLRKASRLEGLDQMDWSEENSLSQTTPGLESSRRLDHNHLPSLVETEDTPSPGPLPEIANHVHSETSNENSPLALVIEEKEKEEWTVQ